MSFAKQLKIGRITEGLIAQWLMSRGTIILPAYEIEKSSGKGPQVFSADNSLVAPDLLTFSHKGIQWIESKHKSVFTWHRNTQRWTTGIDIRHYGDYLHVAKQTRLPVWVLFFHSSCVPDQRDTSQGCPQECPTGLFGGELFSLVTKENHRSPQFDPARTGMKGHGKSGMVYWAADDLKLIATKDEVMAASAQFEQQQAA